MNTVREFKFACPVCHQHIQCDTASSGQTIACPTCFRNIVIPQAPTGHTTKLILLGTQAATARTPQAGIKTRQPAAPGTALGLAGAASVLVIAAMLFMVLKH